MHSSAPSGSTFNKSLSNAQLIEVEGVFEVQRDELSEMYLIEAGKQIALLGTPSSILKENTFHTYTTPRGCVMR